MNLAVRAAQRAAPRRYRALRSVEVAGRFGHSAYDAYFIVCAAVHRAPLLTLDSGLARAAKKAGIRLVEVA